MFRFTIRELALVTIIVAFGAVWWLERVRSQGRARRIAALEGEVQQAGIVIKSLYDDLESIEQSLPAHGASLIWSRDMRPTLQPLPPTATPAKVTSP